MGLLTVRFGLPVRVQGASAATGAVSAVQNGRYNAVAWIETARAFTSLRIPVFASSWEGP